MKKELLLHEKAMESQRQEYRMKQAALSGRLKKSNEALRLKDQLKEQSNALGQRVATATGVGEMLSISIAELPAGIYFVTVSDAEGRKCVRKVVKE